MLGSVDKKVRRQNVRFKISARIERILLRVNLNGRIEIKISISKHWIDARIPKQRWYSVVSDNVRQKQILQATEIHIKMYIEILR